MQAHQLNVGVAAGVVPSAPSTGLDSTNTGGTVNKYPGGPKNSSSSQEAPASPKQKPENTTEPEAISS